MDVLKICGAVLLCTFAALVLKRVGGGAWAAAAAGVLASALFILPKIKEIVDSAVEIEGAGAAVEYFPIVLKVTAVALICEVCADVSTSCGEGTLSKVLLAAGKVEIIFLSLPLIKNLFESALVLCRGN